LYLTDLGEQKEHVESLLRSLLLVFMDNATAEYTFISTFFATQTLLPPVEPIPYVPPSAVLSPDGGTSTDLLSSSASEFETHRPLSGTTPGLGGFVSFVAKSKEETAVIDGLWKQTMDPVMEYCQVGNFKLCVDKTFYNLNRNLFE
jgi:vacuolar protein sorting-associated protein 52